MTSRYQKRISYKPLLNRKARRDLQREERLKMIMDIVDEMAAVFSGLKSMYP